MMRKRIFSIFLTCLLVSFLAMPVAAAKKEEKEPLVIENTAQFLAFAEACRLDTYSRELTVSLETDIDLSEQQFLPVPIFSGTFEGNGHTISGLQLTADGSVQGLFRYLTDTAVVRNLTVEGLAAPNGSRSSVGLLAGSNAGLIQKCTVDGTVEGADRIGGLVGVNAVSGIIEDCTAAGSVSGSHFVGGIVGENSGVIRNCVNEARVNTSARENTVELSDVTIDTLTNTESTGTVTDLGSIAGASNGVIRGCRNTAVVGYRNMGYNIGGIVGTQSGYVVECENNGEVYGRKEVGGIVGHMEPYSEMEYSKDTLQILEGQLNSLSALTTQAGSNAAANASSLTGPLNELQTHAGTAMDAINVLRPGSGADADSMTAAQNALSGSLMEITGSVGEIGSAASGTASDLQRDMNAITNQINAMSRTLDRASSQTGVSIADISDSDKADDTGGKVQQCVNYGTVYGDLNIGGITGAMALQNDLDAQDDWNVSGETSMNVSGEVRAVVLSCENRGTVTGNKNNVGGIVGWQYVGLVKDTLNFGSVNGESADYVGGISGQSSGYIRGCGAKCALKGNTYVGGIAGTASIVTDCQSMVEISGGKERVGAILGLAQSADTEEKQPIRDNRYLVVAQDIGAIDGISYSGQAEPIGVAEFTTQAEVSEQFRTVTLRFVFEEGKTVEITVPLGGSVDASQIPKIPEKSGYVSEWEGLSAVDLDCVMFDMEFKAQYISRSSAVASAQLRENGTPVLLAQGMFTSEANVVLKEREDGPKVGFGSVLHEVWEVCINQADGVEAVRFRLPADTDADYARLYVCDKDGVWREAAFTVDGSYAVLPFTANDTAIAYVQMPVLTYVLVVVLLGILLLVWQNKEHLLKRK